MSLIKKVKYWNEQRKINSLFKKEGASAEVISRQVKLNRKRNEADIPDGSEKVNGDFVQ